MKTMHGMRTAGLTAVVVLILAAGSVPAAAQDGGVSPKLQKQIDVFEGIMNQLLVDSPNYLVPGRNAARGLYLDGYGVVVSFNGTLLDKKEDWGWGWMSGDVKVERDGEKIIITHPEGKKEGKEGKGEKSEFDLKEWQAKRSERQAKLYEAGKMELLETLRDYGETLTQLRDDERVVIAAFLGDNDFFKEEGVSRIVITITMGDLRNIGEGNEADHQFQSRVKIEEY